MLRSRRLENVSRLRYLFVMYYVYGASGPSLLIESTDSMMISIMVEAAWVSKLVTHELCWFKFLYTT